MNSQPDSYTRAEIDHLVEEIYRTLKSAEQRLDRRCDQIYFPMDLNISSLTSQIEEIQREMVWIQRYIARRPQASPVGEKNSGIEFLQTPRRTAASGSPLRDTLGPRYDPSIFSNMEEFNPIGWLRPTCKRLYKGSPSARTRDRHLET
uniref:Uncharacterized protein n=1 Tax=Brassica campestris TaxID=3711 RepID=M4FCU7_BRACM